MAAIAAENVTSAHGTMAGAKAGAGLSGDFDDIFAAILDDITQDLGSGAATPVTPADDATATADASPSTPNPGDTPTFLQTVLTELQARLAPATDDRSVGDSKKTDKSGDAKPQDNNQDNPGLAQILGAPQGVVAMPNPAPVNAAGALSCNPPAQDTATNDLSSDALPLRGDEDAPPPKPLRTQSGVDPALLAGTEAMAPVAASPPAPANDRPDDETPVSPAAVAAPASGATDVAATPMIPTGGAQTPTKPTTAPAADTAKAQPQDSTAAALAVASAEAVRSFGEQPANNALPLHAGADDSKVDGTRKEASNTPASSATTTGAPDAPAPQGPTPPPASAPPQPHPAAQADVASVVAATPATPAAPAAPHLATPISAQFQVLQSDPQDATPNLTALAVTIAAKSADGVRHFDIRLDPPELGRVDVRLTVDDAGRAQAVLAVEKPQTLELLQKDSQQLERALKDAGLDLSQSGLNFSLKGQQQQSGSGNAPTGRHRHTLRAIVAADAASTLSTAAPISDARLDIRV